MSAAELAPTMAAWTWLTGRASAASRKGPEFVSAIACQRVNFSAQLAAGQLCASVCVCGRLLAAELFMSPCEQLTVATEIHTGSRASQLSQVDLAPADCIAAKSTNNTRTPTLGADKAPCRRATRYRIKPKRIRTFAIEGCLCVRADIQVA